MTEPKSSSDITGTSLSHHQTETSPLKQNETKKNWMSFVFWSSSDNDQGSLKTIVIYFFTFSVVVTLGLLAQLYYGGYKVEPHGSVVSDSEECSKIGGDILKKGGNAVDAAIASNLCLGVVNFHITGLGGGGYIMIYNHVKQKVIDIIDFQVTVPNSLVNKDIDTSVDGLTVGVPGLLMGMWEAHQKYGKLQWEELIMPAVNLAKYGFLVDKNVILAGKYLKNNSKYNKNLIELYKSLREGKNITFPELANTLEQIAVSGPYEMYNGSLAADIVYTVKEANGSMTVNDLSQYQIYHNEILHTRFGKFDIYAPGSSSGGAFLLNALDTIQFLDLNPDDDMSRTILRLSDVLHDTYLAFLQKNNVKYFPYEPAASQVSAVDNEEIYVSVVSGLNTWLGSQLMTKSGFILNNAVKNGGMNDLRRPLSFSTPVMALESDEICGKRLVLGSGDATIAAQVLTNALILNYDVNSSIELPRFFVSNVPRLLKVEDLHKPFYSSSTIKKLGPLLKLNRISLPYKSINIIEKINDNVISHTDSRGGGLAINF